MGLAHPLPLLAAVAPLAVAALLALATGLSGVRAFAPLRSPRAGHVLVTATTVALTLAILAAVPQVLAHGALEAAFPALLGTLRFRLDALGMLVALLAGVVWSASGLHACAYLADETPARARRYQLTSLVTFAALLTVVMAADLVTLYLGFEWLGLVAYLFVVHTGSKAAEAAGTKYLVLTLAGGFAVLTGTLLVHALGGGDVTVALAFDPARPGMRIAAAACLLLGFAVKAGALGLHTWLPDAHTAAPAPASALLSGVMLKAGAYGIVRTLTGPFRPDVEAAAAALQQAQTLGLVVLWWGVATMLVGVVLALLQRHAKRLLAYSSVSQMGLVLTGVGAATYLGDAGAIGWTGALAHVVNHGLFKALLFLAVGAVITRAGTGDVAALGGLAQRMPWTFALTLVGVAGIVGVPLLNGFVSKSVLHHAIDDAVARDLGHGLVVAERLFVLATIGTAAALTKLTAGVFLGAPRSDGARAAREAPWTMRVALVPLALAVVALGTRPHLLAGLLASALGSWGLATDGVVGWLSEPITHAPDLSAALFALVVGVGLHVGAGRSGLYGLDLPAWASLDRAALASVRAARAGMEGAQRVTSALAARASRALASAGTRIGRSQQALGTSWRSLVPAAPKMPRVRASVDAGWPAAPRRWGAALVRALEGLDRSWRIALEGGRLADDDRERLARLARERIQRHSRDVGLAMALVVLVWLVLLASLAGSAVP